LDHARRAAGHAKQKKAGKRTLRRDRPRIWCRTSDASWVQLLLLSVGLLETTAWDDLATFLEEF